MLMEFLLQNWGAQALYQFGRDVGMDDWTMEDAWITSEKVPNPPVGWITVNDELYVDPEDGLPDDYFSKTDLEQDLQIYRDRDTSHYHAITDLDLYLKDYGKLGEWLDRLRYAF
jgi:hypothetical protein